MKRALKVLLINGSHLKWVMSVIKGASCSFEEAVWIRRHTPSVTNLRQCFTLLVCGGPCHRFWLQSSVFLWGQLAYSVEEKMNITSFILQILKCLIPSPKLQWTFSLICQEKTLALTMNWRAAEWLSRSFQSEWRSGYLEHLFPS